MNSTHEHLVLLAEVAMLYYQKGMTQGQIAAILDVSRSTVSRLLDEALRERIVEITIHYPWQSHAELSGRLEERFRLQAARVLCDTPDDEERFLAGLGALAARYLTSVLRDDTIVGVSWGRAIYHTIKQLRVGVSPKRRAVQVVGVGNLDSAATDASGLVRLLVDTVGGTPHYLHAPRIVEDETVRDALLKDRSIEETLDLARRADILLVSVRGTGPALDVLDPAEYLGSQPARQLGRGTPVGEICGLPFDINGLSLDTDFSRRVVGIDLASLQDHQHVMAITGGERHILAILGALRGHYINVLITDEKTARALLDADRILLTA